MSDGGQSGMYQFPNTKITPEMMDMVTEIISDRTKNVLFPRASDFWNDLKIYFAVSNSYVLKKISIVLYPMTMRNQSWGRIRADEAAESGYAVRL